MKSRIIVREPSLLDKAIAAISPSRALQREVARQKLGILNSGYSRHGANTTKKSMLDWDTETGSPDEDINDNLDLLRARSRDLYMGGSNIATSAIKTMRTNAVGYGLVLKPSIDYDFLRMSDETAEAWEKTTAREFNYFASSVNCDRFRLNNFYELQQLAFMSVLLSGDVFALLPYRERNGFLYDLRIQLIEGDRVRTPDDRYGDSSISQGVEKRGGEVAAYFISNQHPSAVDFDGSHRRIPAFGRATGRRNVLHLMESERVDQTRGVPYLAPVMESLRHLGKYTEAELRAAVVSGMFTAFVTSDIPQAGLGEGMPEDEQIDAENDYTYELGPGAIVTLAPGEKISTANPGRPNAAFEGFVRASAQGIGASLEQPYDLVMKVFGDSYSASRAAMLEAWKVFRNRRRWFAGRFCQPVYEEWMTEAVAKGRIHAPGFFGDPIIRAAYCKAEWHGPSQGQIDPLKEVAAAIKRIDAGISTREREAAEMTGTDFNVNHRQRVKEETMRMELTNLERGGDDA